MAESGLVANPSKIISLPFFVNIPESVAKKDFKNPVFKVLQLCRLIEGKGVEISIEAFALLKKQGYGSIELFIGGTGPNEKVYRELITKYNVEDQVELAGWINAEQLASLRAQSLLLIHPVNNHDPFPLVVLESLANAIPVVGSTLAGSVVERITDGINGFAITPNSAKLLAEKIVLLYKDRQLLEQMSVLARKGAEEWPVSKGVEIVEKALLTSSCSKKKHLSWKLLGKIKVY
jgi:glycosyltransferase involved in cell wall biosynthesis